MVDSSKRRLLFLPDIDETSSPLPWLIHPDRYEQDCTQCGECIKNCETKIIVKNPDGYPRINFTTNECTFCYACADVCAEPIFLPKAAKPWRRVATVTDACLAKRNVECRSCSEACEPLAIRFQLQIGKVAQPYIDTDSCTGCGGCISVCPVSAINISA